MTTEQEQTTTELKDVNSDGANESKSNVSNLLDAKTIHEGGSEADSTNPSKDVEERTDDVKLYAGKYKEIEDLEKGYKEAIQKLRSKGLEAPESYDINEDLGFDPEDETLKAFIDIAKKNNLSNEALNDILNFKAELDKQHQVNVEDELEKLGPKANEIISEVDSFYKSKLDADGYEAVKMVATTADGVKALHQLMKGLAPTQPVNPKSVNSTRTVATEQEAQAKLAKASELYKEGKFEEAAVVRKQAEKMFEELFAK